MEEKKNNVPKSRPTPPPPPPPRPKTAVQPVQNQQARPQMPQPQVQTQNNAYVQPVQAGTNNSNKKLNDKKEQKEIGEMERIKGKSGSGFLTALYWISFVLALGAIGLLIYMLIR